MSKFERGSLDQSSVRQIVKFLFGKDNNSKFMDMRTDIAGQKMFGALTYYRLMEEQLNSKTAGAVAGVIERLSISMHRGARLEATATLQQKFPKVETLEKGISDLLLSTRD